MANHSLIQNGALKALTPARLLAHILAHPRTTLLVLCLVTLFLAIFIPRLSFKTAVHDLVIESLPEAVAYTDFRDRFGSEELIRVVIRCDDVFDEASFAAITHLSEAAEQIPGVSRVISLPVIKAAVDMANNWPMARFRQLVASVPLFDRNLVSRDAHTTALTLVLTNEAVHAEVIRATQALIDTADKGLKVYPFGMPLVSEALGMLTQNDFLFLPPLTALVVVIVLFGVLPLKRLVFIPPLSVGLALVWAFGLMGLWGLPLSLLTLIVPVFLIAVGTAYCLHILSAFVHHLPANATVAEAVTATFVEMAPPTALAVATTVVGLTSLLLNSITAIREFALFASMGMLALLVMLLIGLPAVLALLPVPVGDGAVNRKTRGQRRVACFTRLVVCLGRSSRRPYHLFALALLVLFCLLGMLRLRVETSPMAYFQEDTEIAVRFKDIGQRLSGSFPANLVISASEADYFENPLHLKTLETLQGWLETLPGVDKTISFVDYLKLVNYASNRYDVVHYVLPEEDFEIRMLINSYRSMLGKALMTPFMVGDFSEANILLMTRFKRSGEFLDLRQRIGRHIEETLPRELNASLTGLGLTLSASSRALTMGQIKSLLITLAVVFVILALLCLSFKVALISLMPNIFPIVITFGAMGWLGIELSMVTSLIASVAIGLAVDDTIHYLVRYNREIKRDLDKERALEATLTHLVRPVVFTTLTIGLGFSILTFSSFIPTAVFGLMMIFTLCAALVGDLVILPTLLQRTELATLWDLIRIKLGRDPGNAIPLFENLSRLQMNFALMAGVLKKLSVGETLLVQGQSEAAMYVVISGALDVRVAKCRRETAPYPVSKKVNQVGCGGIVGEMGLFREKGHTATVTATAPTDVLQINRQMIQRLELLHPRAARRLMQNLVRTLCDKLEMMTAHLALESVRDDITGLYNPNGFHEVLANAVCRARRYKEFLTLCLVHVDTASVQSSTDVDGLTTHRELCRSLYAGLRCSDTLSPLDNTTFAVLLPRTAAHKARTVCERIRAIVDRVVQGHLPQPADVRLVVTHLDDPGIRAGGDLLQEALRRLDGLVATAQHEVPT